MNLPPDDYEIELDDECDDECDCDYCTQPLTII
jgi:hypothetical protein